MRILQTYAIIAFRERDQKEASRRVFYPAVATGSPTREAVKSEPA